jgi:hypothetical protein
VDVQVGLHANPLLVDAVISLAHVSEPTEQVLQQLTDASLPEALAATAADIEGIGAVSAGAIGVEVVSPPHIVLDPPLISALASAPEPAPAPMASPATARSTAAQDAEVCYPHCEEGHGICSEGVCFCKHPYYGTGCRKELGASLRVQWPIALLLVIVALIGGALVGGIAFEAYLERYGAQGSKFDVEDDLDESLGANTFAVSEASQIRRPEVWTPGGDQR